MRIKKNLIRVSASLCLLPAFVFSQTVSAATLVSTGSFLGFDLMNFYSYEDGFSSADTNFSLNNQAITGLSKFDPTLGTLVSATISASFTYTVNSSVEVFTLLDEDPNLAHSAGFTVDSGTGFPDSDQSFIGIQYVEGTSSYPMATDNFSSGASCFSDNSFEGGCADYPFDSYTGLMDSGDLMTPNQSNWIPQSEFVGTGSINSLVMALVFPNGSAWTTDNIFEAEGTIEAIVDPGSVSIVYDYTPTPVPLPGAAWLFGSTLIGAGVIRRRKKAQA